MHIISIFMMAPPPVNDLNYVPSYPLPLLLIAFVLIIFLYRHTKLNGFSPIMGTIEIVLAFVGYNWATSHSPYKIGYYNVTWFIKEPFYSLYLIVIALYALHGIVNIYKSISDKRT